MGQVIDKRMNENINQKWERGQMSDIIFRDLDDPWTYLVPIVTAVHNDANESI